jgi:hypothetical protein
MTARDEMKRLSPSSTPLKTLADIIEGCMIEKPAIHVYDMALGDYEFLLHRLRVVTYGPDFKINVRCPECNKPIETVTSLDDIALKEFDLNEFDELRDFALPESGKRVVLKFMTPRMMDEISAKAADMQRRYRNAPTDFETLAKLTVCVDTIDGVKLSPIDFETTLNHLPAKDLLKILNNLDKLNQCLGLDNRLYITCPQCGGEFLNFFRFGPEFFRPTTI